MIRLLAMALAVGVAATPPAAQDAATRPATAPATLPAIAGVWIVQVTPISPDPDDISDPVEHRLTFDAQRLKVTGPLGEGFGSTPWEFHAPDFRAVFDREQAGNVLWAGELTGDNVIRGMIIRTDRNGDVQIHRFAGEPANDR